MKIKTLTIILPLILSTSLKAENYMLVMGGGGEPQGNTTIFDSTMKTLGNNLKNSDWKYQIAFNGGHADTEAIMSSQYPTPIAPITNFSAENYRQMISEYKAKILMGDIGPGDQIMIILNTHGAAKTPNQKTHLVSASGGAAADLNSLSGSKLVSVDELAELVKLTNEKGIRLGLVDLSCHSGNTMALKQNAPNTCIITATGPKHYGFAGDSAFSGQLMKNLKKGTTLEMAFLNARADTRDAGFPMISTDENDQIVAEIYASITPYLYYYDPKADKLTDYILENSKDCVTCKRDQQFQDLMNKITQLQNATRGRKNGFNADELKRLLTDYKKTQDELLNAQKALGTPMLSKVEKYSTPVTVKGKSYKPFEISFNWQDLLNLDTGSIIRNFEKYRNQSKKDSKEWAENQAIVDTYHKIKAKQDEILNAYPNLKSAKEESKKIVQRIGENRETAEKIALQEKKFYDELYRQKQSFNTNDPCRKIVF